ncbi:FdtA/QdtA family cupin domain-containing protein [Polaribacter haliotis]|uniref:FdtA/QdtA family cupin domain-containing protein n=1 Tax=Polaribacter haliotis TaxID=1888915 RepID=A0A7L8AHQ3_9FLAO|nr:FdtA/QdtA family cupin domain-containing protein [Polaribacter haliotis]QOD61530.1 FdtA/QdtA family cupin domain-containing protein [Polaribacter haliotis]
MKNKKPYIIEFDSIGSSELGYISVAEAQKQVPFDIKRVYWTYFTPNNVQRGHHAHKNLQQIIVAVSGVIEFKLTDKLGFEQVYILNTPSKGLYIPELYWREISFSHNAVLLCLASEFYIKSDYIRNFQKFKNH